MAIIDNAAGTAATIVLGGPAGLSGRDGNDSTVPGPIGPVGPASTVPGPPGTGTTATRTAATSIAPSTYVVDQPGGMCAVADPRNPAHRGKLLGLVVAGAGAGLPATIQSIGPISGVSGTFNPGDALYIGDGTTGRLGSIVNVPPAASSTVEVWRQQVGTATTTTLINALLGPAYRVQMLGGQAIVGASGGYAAPASSADIVAQTAGKWIDPVALGGVFRTDPTDTSTARPILTAPYLLGLRNKTINVKRYTTLAGAFADIADGFTLDVPAGNFQATGTAGLPLSNVSVAVRGEGKGVSRLYFPSGSQGLVLSQDSYFRTMLVQGLSLHSQGVNTGTALAISRPTALSGIQSGPRLLDLDVLGDDPSVHGWSVGIDLNYCWNTLIQGFQFQGINAQTIATALLIRGQSTPVTMIAANIVWANRAVWAQAGSFSEGFIAEGCQVVACNEAYFFDDPSNPNQPAGNAPLVEIRGGHSATFQYGVRAVNRNSVKVSGHTFYKRADSAQNWAGVQLSAGSSVSDVSSCNFFGYKGTSAGGTATGVVIQGAIGCALQGSALLDLDVGVAPVDQAVLVKNNRARNVTTWASNTPSGSQIDAPFSF